MDLKEFKSMISQCREEYENYFIGDTDGILCFIDDGERRKIESELGVDLHNECADIGVTLCSRTRGDLTVSCLDTRGNDWSEQVRYDENDNGLLMFCPSRVRCKCSYKNERGGFMMVVDMYKWLAPDTEDDILEFENKITVLI